MAGKPFNKREYDLFVSYSHKDVAVVAPIVDWLKNKASIDVAFDQSELKMGRRLATEIPKYIENSKGALIFISENSLGSGWVEEEYNFMIEERTRYPEYKIVPVRLSNAKIPAFIRTTLWVNIDGDKPTLKTMNDILGAFYPGSGFPVHKAKDIYVSRGWRTTEIEIANTICSYFIDAGFRLVSDSSDNEVFAPETRIKTIMESCGAVLVIAPDRDGKTSPFIEDEIQLAHDNGIDYLLIADDKLNLRDELVSQATGKRCYKFSEFLDQKSSLPDDVISDMLQSFKKPARTHFSFYGTSLLKKPDTSNMVRQLVEQITGVECVLGMDFNGRHAQQEIISRISKALFMIADISDDNYNTLIEAGIAMGAGTTLFLVCQGDPRPNRFMFRDLEVNYYQDDMELLGYIHRFAIKYRRRIINSEEINKRSIY